ncbi:MAG: hypothetical protein AB7V77_05510, partial [Candidatus Woesearchaeota archaeon]
MYKKAQVALFVILGIIILFVFSLMASTSRNLYESQLESQAQENLNEVLETRAINRYVSTCVNTIASEGLILLGEQGGVLYTFQGGLTNLSNLIMGKDYLPYQVTKSYVNDDGEIYQQNEIRNVTYAITDLIDNCDIFYPPTPTIFSLEYTSYYPALKTYLSDFKAKYSLPFYLGGCHLTQYRNTFSGFLGKNNIPSLCNKNGANKEIALLSGEDICYPHFYNDTIYKISIQEQIESYIQNNIHQCLDLEKFNFFGSNVEPIENETKVTVIFRTDKLEVNVKSPFNVIVDEKPIKTYSEFISYQKIDLINIYKFVFNLISTSSHDPSFDLKRDWRLTKGYYPLYFLTFNEEICKDFFCGSRAYFDDLISVVDLSSNLNGEKFVFNFASMQRKPILDYMHDNSQYGEYKPEGETIPTQLDYQFMVNSTIEFKPNAVDANSDILTFNYSGWREDYTTYF